MNTPPHNTTHTTTLYPSDLTDAEWAHLEPLLPTFPTGRPRVWPARLIVDAVFYLLRTGGSWRMLPREYPPWQTVYDRFRRWRDDGTWETVHARVRERARAAVGRDPTPSGAVMDSQSVKTTERGGTRGYDGFKKVKFKKVKGRRRHLLVDTQGLVLEVRVLPANVSDTAGAFALLEPLAGRSPRMHKYPRMHKLWCDRGYRRGVLEWAEDGLGWETAMPVVGVAGGPAGAGDLGGPVAPAAGRAGPAALGGGADVRIPILRVAWAAAASVEGLRAAAPEQRGDGVPGHAAADAAAPERRLQAAAVGLKCV